MLMVFFLLETMSGESFEGCYSVIFLELISSSFPLFFSCNSITSSTPNVKFSTSTLVFEYFLLRRYFSKIKKKKKREDNTLHYLLLTTSPPTKTPKQKKKKMKITLEDSLSFLEKHINKPSRPLDSTTRFWKKQRVSNN